jgi:Zn-dependent protease
MIGLTLGRVFGTEVRVHWTWVPIIAFIAVVFGIDLTDGSAAHWSTALAWGSSIAMAALVFASVTAHELAHVKVARQNGQNVPVVVVQLLGGPYIMEVKPRTAGEELRIALAGSAFSLVMAVAFGVVAAALVLGPIDLNTAPDGIVAIGFVTTMVAAFNVLLCLINLVPGYPLDGARVLHAVVWRSTGQESVATAAAIRVGRLVGIFLVVAGVLIGLLADVTAGLCLVVAGWLVMSSSRFLDRRSLLQELISGLHVSDAEDTAPARVPPQLTLDVFAGEYMGERLGAAALVERGTELLGLIGTAQIRRIPRAKWTETHTEQAMVRIDDVPRVNGDTDLWSALELLERTGQDALLVGATEAGTVLVTRRSAAKVVHERAEERQRQLAAQGETRKSRFRGR